MKEERPLLIVEDNDLNREMLREFLCDEYEVLEARDGQEGLEILKQYGTGLSGVVLDLNMPIMDGYQFLEHYSANPDWAEVPVLVATADSSAGVENRCLQLGAWDFILKPYNPDVVLLRLRNNIDHRRLAEMRRRRVKDTFSRYMEPAVVDALLREGVTDEDLRGKSTEIAVLFVDIRGFTSLSEQLEADKVVEILNQFLTLTSEAVEKNGGTLDKYIGDCTMAFWGAPLTCDDKTYRACRAALDMMEKVEEYGAFTKDIYGWEVSFAVGIHVGTAVVGSFGSPTRKDYTAIGDTVNTASRLEAQAPAGQIYISRAVADRLGERGRYTSLGSGIHLKGKAQELEILTLDGLNKD